MGSLCKITIHWTAGMYKPNDCEKSHYHFLIDGDGKVVKGKYKPEDNINCQDGKYAPHTGGGNTGNIGVAICGMWNKEVGITRKQVEACCKLVAELSYKYGIPVSSKNIFTHAEFGERYPNSTSRGKIDVNRLDCVCVYGVEPVGRWLRNKIAWYRSKL